MTDQEATQQTIFGDTVDEQITIQTEGRAIRPWVRMLRQIAGEWRFQFDESGITVAATDKGNVMGIWTEFDAACCDEWDVSESMLGVSETAVSKALKHARYGKSTNDTIQIVAGQDHLETETHGVSGRLSRETANVTRERQAVIDEYDVDTSKASNQDRFVKQIWELVK